MRWFHREMGARHAATMWTLALSSSFSMLYPSNESYYIYIVIIYIIMYIYIYDTWYRKSSTKKSNYCRSFPRETNGFSIAMLVFWRVVICLGVVWSHRPARKFSPSCARSLLLVIPCTLACCNHAKSQAQGTSVYEKIMLNPVMSSYISGLRHSWSS
jgi:magnesium-transporting ATPase (P-type)